MTLGNRKLWAPAHLPFGLHRKARKQLGIPTAIVDALCLSAIMWLVVLAILH